MLTPWSGESPSRPPSRRLSQPLRTLEPGLASSTSSMAAKCDRLATAMPVACTAASSPDCHIGSRGARLGCSPKKASLPSSLAAGTAMRGRAA